MVAIDECIHALLGTVPAFLDWFVSIALRLMRTGKRIGVEPKGPALVKPVITEANVITALSCHANDKRPVSICLRPVIKYLKWNRSPCPIR